MPDIKLKDLKGNPQRYDNINKIIIPSAGSDTSTELFENTFIEDKPANSPNISKGFKAWVNGQLVEGSAEIKVENTTLVIPAGFVNN